MTLSKNQKLKLARQIRFICGLEEQLRTILHQISVSIYLTQWFPLVFNCVFVELWLKGISHLQTFWTLHCHPSTPGKKIFHIIFYDMWFLIPCTTWNMKLWLVIIFRIQDIDERTIDYASSYGLGILSSLLFLRTG